MLEEMQQQHSHLEEEQTLIICHKSCLKSKCLPISIFCFALCWFLISPFANTSGGVLKAYFGQMTLSSSRSVDNKLCDGSFKTSSRSTTGTSGKIFRMQQFRNYSLEYNHSELDKRTPDSISNFSKRPLLDENDIEFPTCEVWAVITSINPPTKTVSQLALMSDLCVCIVADLQSPVDYDVQNVIYLTPEMQRSLPYKILDHLPWNHFGRKNLGYLFAIHHGAKVIYDADDDNELLDSITEIPHVTLDRIDRFFSIPDKEIRNPRNMSTINPYPFFGASQAWPRGFPLDRIRQSTLENVVVKQGLPMSLGVIQSLANNDPDVDAIYRLSPLRLPFSFSVKDEVVALQPCHHMCPYNAQATLHFERAFWVMLLPISVHGRVSDIWRSYFAERLLRDIDVVIAISSPWVVQFRNSHNYLSDFDAEEDLYEKSTALVAYLANNWACGSSETSDCLLELTVDMYNHGILESRDVELVKAWVGDLKAVGYSFPKITEMTHSEETNFSDLIIPDFQVNKAILTQGIREKFGSKGDDLTEVIEISVSPAITVDQLDYAQEAPLSCRSTWTDIYRDDSLQAKGPILALTATQYSLNTTSFLVDISRIEPGSPLWLVIGCISAVGTTYSLKLSQAILPMPVFDDILLVINYNHGDYSMLGEYLSIYGQAFPNHIAIGTDEPPDSSLVAPEGPIHVRPEVNSGWNMHRAIQYAMESRPGFRGYLLANNDVAMRFWKWTKWDQDTIWAPKVNCGYINVTTPLVDSKWRTWHWSEEIERHTFSKLISSLDETQKLKVFEPCGLDGLYNMWSDAFYVPGVLQTQYLDVVRNFDDSTLGRAFEAVVPMLLSMTAPYSLWMNWQDLYCWDEGRTTICPTKFKEDPTIDIVHPWKIGHPQLAEVKHPFYDLQGKKIWLSQKKDKTASGDI